MGQTVQLKAKGLYTAPNDFTGAPDGAWDVGDDVVIDQRELAESRRGFEALPFALPSPADRLRRFTWYQDRLIAHYGGDKTAYYDSALGWQTDAGSFPDPDPLTARARFLQTSKNLYLTTSSGVWKKDTFNGAWRRAGVPPALDMTCVTTGVSGFFLPNEDVAVTATATSGSPNLTLISSLAGIFVGQYVIGTGIPANTTVLSITQSQTVLTTTGNTTAGSTSVTNIPTNSGLAAGVLVSGPGIPPGARVVTVTGTGPYTVTLSLPATATATGAALTFSSDPTVTLSNNATSTSSGTTYRFSRGSQIAYQQVWGIKDANGLVTYGAPTAPSFVTNTTGSSTNVQVNFSIPSGITTSHFYQLYRSVQTSGAGVTPDAEVQLVFEGNPTAGDLTAGFVQVTDITPDSMKGLTLYTAPSQQGATAANAPPPLCRDIAFYRGYTIYANVTFKQRLSLNILAVGGTNGVQVGDTITIGGVTFTGAASENTATGQFLVQTSGTPAQNIAATAASLVRVINRWASSTSVYAYVVSGFTDVPGKIRIEERGVGGPQLAVTSNRGTWTSPALPTSGTTVQTTADNKKNWLIISKNGEPESTPEANFAFAGDDVADILRVIPLRDYVFILKTDGVYRLTGTNYPFNVEPFNPTLVLVAPDSAVALADNVYGLFNQGVTQLSDGGTNVISPPIDDIVRQLFGTAISTVAQQSLGCAYETDKAYLLALPQGSGDAIATQGYRYSYATSTWTRFSRSFSALWVHPTEDKLYIGNNSNVISRERKTGTFRDYADEEFAVTITAVSGTTVTLSSILGINPGDILAQGSLSFSQIRSVDAATNSVVLEQLSTFANGAASVFPAITNVIRWKPISGGNPAVVRQANEGLVLFKSGQFNTGSVSFATDISQSFEAVPIRGYISGGWGQFAWGVLPWGGNVRPRDVRFYVPRNKQYGSQHTVELRIRAAWSAWKCSGVSLAFEDIGIEVGK